MTNPAITVLLPVYNAERYLHACMDSILAQSFTDFECLAIDDGSTDHSGHILDDYAVKDSRVRVIHQENRKLIATLNRGIEEAKADLIARMDADDICLPERFQKQIDFMRAHPDVAILGSSIRLIDPEGSVIRDVIYPTGKAVMAQLMTANPMAHPSVMFRKDLVKNLGGYRKAFDHAGEDYDLWLRVSEKSKLDNLTDVLIMYRQHDNKMSFTQAYEQALGMVIAPLAHYARKAGRADPTLNAPGMSENLLDEFGLRPEEKANTLLQTYNHAVGVLMYTQGTDALLERYMEQATQLVSQTKKHQPYADMAFKIILYFTRQGKTRRALEIMAATFCRCPIASMHTIAAYAVRRFKSVF